MPDNIRICGELIAPPARITQPASTRTSRPRCRYSTPTARAPSMSTRRVSACVSTVRFWRAANRREVRARSRTAQAVPLRDLVEAETFLRCAVEVGVAREARRRRGIDGDVGEFVVIAQVRDRERTARAVPGVGAATVVFGVLEHGQHRIPRPARVTGRCGPVVVVARSAARVAHRVDRARAAEHFSARPPQPAMCERGLGLGVIVPVDALVVDQLGETRRHVDERMPVAAAGFEHEHALCRIRAQPVREHAAGGAGADDHVVVGHRGWRIGGHCRLGGVARADAPARCFWPAKAWDRTRLRKAAIPAFAGMTDERAFQASTSISSPTRTVPFPRGITFCPNVTPRSVRR